MMHIGGRQIRAARALLDISQEDLAKATGLTPQSIRKIESGDVQPREGTMNDIMRAFDDRGVAFTDNHGVRLKPHSIETYVGSDGFSRFYDFVDAYLAEHGGQVCVSGVDERLFSKYRNNPEKHRLFMADLVQKRSDISMQILIQEGDTNFTATTYAHYRWQNSEAFSPSPFYVFGDNLALISFAHDPAPLVILLKSTPFAEAYRQAFKTMWNTAQIPPETFS